MATSVDELSECKKINFWLSVFRTYNLTKPTKNKKISTQPNPTQPNPWFDPTHGQL